MNKRYPKNKLDEAAMRVFACAGFELIFADSDPANKECDAFHAILTEQFTDDSAAELVLDSSKREARLRDAINLIKAMGGEQEKALVISCLARLAIADGQRAPEESFFILDTAMCMGMTPAQVQLIILETTKTQS